MNSIRRYYTISQAAKILQVSRDTLLKMIKKSEVRIIGYRPMKIKASSLSVLKRIVQPMYTL